VIASTFFQFCAAYKYGMNEQVPDFSEETVLLALRRRYAYLSRPFCGSAPFHPPGSRALASDPIPDCWHGLQGVACIP
jgi:hypothetical protein